MTGKGDKRRPQQVPDEILSTNWDAAFGPKWEARIGDKVIATGKTCDIAKDKAVRAGYNVIDLVMAEVRG